MSSELLVRVVVEPQRFAVSWDGRAPLRLGRALNNDIVLSQPFISGHHLQLTASADGAVVLEDLGSRNGCWVEGVRLQAPTPVLLGQRIFLGTNCHILVMRLGPVPLPPVGWALVGTDGALVAELVVGDHALAGLLNQPDVDGTLRLTAGRPPRLVLGSVSVALQLGEPFAVAGQYYLLSRSTSGNATASDHVGQLPVLWSVEVRNAYTMPNVSITDQHSGRRCSFRPSHAATLLMLLAERAQECAPKPGWVSDDDLRVGLWGRAGLLNDPNNLNVVIYRIRNRLRRAGLSPEVVCKEPQWTRLKRSRIHLSPSQPEAQPAQSRSSEDSP